MKKGFTLIELLAVIVILAIIALIAVPIILGIVNDTKASSNKRSAELYLKAATLAIARANLNDTVGDTTCVVQAGGNLNCDGKIIQVDIDNTDLIGAGGTIVFSNGKIVSVSGLKIGDEYYNLGSDGKLVLDVIPCNVINAVPSIAGSEVACGTEHFYVLSTDGQNVRMLAAKNITLSTTNPVQTDTYTPTYFSDTPYWLEGENCDQEHGWSGCLVKQEYPSSYYSYVYDENSNLYKYVNKYADTLKRLGIEEVTSELITIDDLYGIPRETHPQDLKPYLKDAPDSAGTQVINELGEEGIQAIVDACGLDDLWNYSEFSDFEVAKAIALLQMTIEDYGLSDAEDSEKIALIKQMIEETNEDIRDWLPEWAYDREDYWSGFGITAASLCYPWKDSWDCGAGYANSTGYSIRPVVTIPVSDIKLD